MLREDCEDVKGKSAIRMPVSPKKLTYYQDYDGDLNIAMDAWMSPNHRVLCLTVRSNVRPKCGNNSS